MSEKDVLLLVGCIALAFGFVFSLVDVWEKLRKIEKDLDELSSKLRGDK